MKFKYTGDRESYAFREIVFLVGVPVDVTDELYINKLSANPEFSEVKTRKTKVKTNGNSGTDKGQGGL
jgi:hypothetical protein